MRLSKAKKVTFYEPNQMTAVIVSPDKGKKMTFPRWHRFKKRRETYFVLPISLPFRILEFSLR